MRRSLLILFLGTAAFGQQSVIQKVLNGVTTATASAPVQNIGQVSHQINVGVASLGSFAFDGQLEFSFDDTNWFAFGSPQSSTLSQGGIGLTAFAFSGSGVYPYVRFNLKFLSCGNCAVTAYYSGTQSGNAAVQSQGVVPLGTQIGKSAAGVNPLLLGLIGNSSVVTLPVNCGAGGYLGGAFGSFETLSAGTSVLYPAPAGDPVVVVCGMIATMSAAGTIQFFDALNGTNCVGSPITLTPAFSLAASTPLVVPPGAGTGFLSLQSGFDLCATVTGGPAQIYLITTTLQ